MGVCHPTSQLDWLKQTLTSIKHSTSPKALVIATHHPPYSSAGHSGSTEMNDDITALCTQTGVLPDLFLSAGVIALVPSIMRTLSSFSLL